MNSKPNDAVVFARDTIDKQSDKAHREINETVVSLLEPTIPVPWDSADKGATYDCGNYICVLLKSPHCIYEVKPGCDIYPKEFIARQREMHRAMDFKYLYAMFCYWKKGMNPAGMDSARPAQIYTIETSKFATIPVICGFSPKTRWNGGDLNGPATEENVAIEMFKRLTGGHPEKARRIGDLSVGYELQTGKKFVEYSGKSGCLGALALILAIPASIICLVLFVFGIGFN